METKQSSSKLSASQESEAKRSVICFQLKNLIKSHTKQFAILLKMLLKNDPKLKR